MRHRREGRPDPAETATFEDREAAPEPVITEVEEADSPPADEGPAPDSLTLFEPEEEARFKERWRELQTEFVDDPRGAVRQAHALVSEVTDRLTDRFTLERDELEREWDGGAEVSTESLRLAIRRYRTFFDRLLAV